MGPERKLYLKLKKYTPRIKWTRLENISLLGTPDLLGYNNSGHFFTLELKCTAGNKIKFSPHQIAFHVKHPHNTYILIEALGQRSSKLFQRGNYFLFPGSRIRELVASGLELGASGLPLGACCLELSKLGA